MLRKGVFWGGFALGADVGYGVGDAAGETAGAVLAHDGGQIDAEELCFEGIVSRGEDDFFFVRGITHIHRQRNANLQ
jgi:hypothetical protein